MNYQRAAAKPNPAPPQTFGRRRRAVLWSHRWELVELGIVSEWQQLARMASKADMTPEEREAKEQEEFSTGPLRVLTDSVKNNTQVLINCR